MRFTSMLVSKYLEVRPSGMGCDLNRWMQHLDSNYRAEGVVNEAETEKIFH